MDKYHFTGTARWAKLYDPELTFDKKGHQWTIDLIMDDPSFKLFERSGLSLKVREADGNKFVTFKRPTARLIKGSTVEVPPTKITNEDGSKVQGLIGNGSKVTCIVSVYPTMKGKGHRLEEVVVHKLVEYIKPKEYKPDDLEDYPF